MSDLMDLSARALAATIRAGRASAVEATEAALARIESRDDDVAAFTCVTPELALAHESAGRQPEARGRNRGGGGGGGGKNVGWKEKEEREKQQVSGKINSGASVEQSGETIGKELKKMEEEWGLPVKGKKGKKGSAATTAAATPDAISRAPSGAPAATNKPLSKAQKKAAKKKGKKLALGDDDEAPPTPTGEQADGGDDDGWNAA